MRVILPAIIVLLGIGVLFSSNFFTTQQLTISEGSNREVAPVTNPIIQEVQKREDLLLPDLKLEAPRQLYIQNRDGQKLIRFDTTFANIGEGQLELVGEPDAQKGVTRATQKIKKTDGSTEDRLIGEFVYHPTHKHWHVNNYAQFQLLSYDKMGEPKTVLGETNKFSFCIWDEHTYDLTIANAPRSRGFPRCPKNIQGMSVGWGDTYAATTDGQELDITGIPDGSYMIRSVVNAENSILESNYENNQAVRYVQISGNSIKIINSVE